MFSVVIPLYNKAQSITATLKSVLAQSFENFEIVLVNDGSTDGSLEVAKKIQDPRIRIIEKENGGVSSARNRGIREAKYDWIAFLDGDDLWTKKHLQTVNNMIKSFPEDAVFCTSFLYSNNDLSTTGSEEVKIIDDYFLEAINSHFFWTSIAVIKKRVLIEANLFNEHLIFGEDLDLWSKIARTNRIIKSNLFTGIYKIDAENRACYGTYNYDKSFISTISLRDKSKSEKKYLRKLLLRRMFGSIKVRDFNSFYEICKKLFVI